MDNVFQLKTVSDVIEAFGGPTAMAEEFGGTQQQFSNFKARGAFSRNMRIPIYVACMKRGLQIAPELVGMTIEEMNLLQTGAHQQPPVAAE